MSIFLQSIQFRHLISLTLVLLSLGNHAQAQRSYSDPLAEVNLMDTLGLDRGLATILNRFYEGSFGGAQHWETIRTIRFEGEYQHKDSTTRFIGLRRKPNLLKLTLILTDGNRRIMCYDGTEAWTMITGKLNAAPVRMNDKEAKDFILGSDVGGLLLYPKQEGKTIDLIGTATVDGHSCYELELTLSDGTKSVHLLDATKFVERRTINIDKESGIQEITTHSDFRLVDGIPFSFHSETEIDGEIVIRIVLDDVKTNVGIPSWTFEKPKDGS